MSEKYRAEIIKFIGDVKDEKALKLIYEISKRLLESESSREESNGI